ncbi:putative membrane protein [[Clostridium] sordellii ATCC 9714]|nr:putative membrane protein [[Clostridium] sordellii ATCC 9714] [Paeniclostridium sordellii ATCC 9714]
MIVCISICGICGLGIADDICVNLVPIVSDGKLNIFTIIVDNIKAIIEAGIFLFILGQ